MDAELNKQFSDQAFEVKMSKRYHDHRITFWTTLLKTSEVIAFLLGASALTTVWQRIPDITLWITVIGTFLVGLVTCFQASARIKANTEQRNAFGELEKLFPVDRNLQTYEILSKIMQGRNNIENKDGIYFPCLAMRSYREECRAEGKPFTYPLTWFQKYIGSILPIPYEGPMPMSAQSNTPARNAPGETT